METTFDKQGCGKFLAKYRSNGNLMRTAEQFESGVWIICIYSGMDISGEYTDENFKKNYRKYF